ncbi:PREDICTED: toll-like receptor 13 [Cyprinodon variegatus]|uniref:toll-like receptor 13 n=1 Tax=Cyprinodon variegatus TaxID=28743 RepID=UPI00074293F6|nr:PREDICTED: toll-like receptor 13 [Cyprinodon variegatus]
MKKYLRHAHCDTLLREYNRGRLVKSEAEFLVKSRFDASQGATVSVREYAEPESKRNHVKGPEDQRAEEVPEENRSSGFIRWAKDNKQTQVANTSQYICEFPLPKQGSLLLDFDILSCRDDGTFFCFISSTCLVVLTLLIPFIHHYLRWKLGYTFHLFLAFLYDSKKRKKGDSYRFDAFVSYNINDEDWVYREMLPMLEEKQGWRLCLHHRDFQPGKPIIENITDAIYSSRKTICVISRSYLQSEWCSREIQMARYSFRLFDEKRDVLILLFLEEIPGYLLSPYFRMRKLVKKRTYLSWPQAAHHPGVFWQMVQRALHTRNALTENTNRLTGPTGH